MAAISTLLSPNLLQPTKPFVTLQQPTSRLPLYAVKLQNLQSSINFSVSHLGLNPRELPRRVYAVAEETAVLTQDPKSEAARRLYVGNIPRTVNNDELRTIVEEHGAVEKAEVMYDKYSGRSRRFGFVTMKTVEDATAAAEKLNGTQVGGRPIKVNITESPLSSGDVSVLQTDNFIDSPYKVYVGNLPSTVTTESLKDLFAEKGKVLSARVSRTPGTSKSSGFGFVTFSSEEDVEAAISALNDTRLDGQKIRVNKA